MANFAYEAMRSDGRRVRGHVDAGDELAALDEIATLGLTPLTLSEGADALSWWQRDISLSGGSKLPVVDVMHFFTTLGTMLGARFSLTEALRFCQEQMQRPAARLAAENISRSVQNGQSLAIALENARPRFPERLISLVAAGEAANSLPEVTSSIARGLADEQKLRRDLQSALIYPALLGVMSLLVIGLLVFYLAPTLAPVFQSSGVEPPLVIRAMASTRAFVLAAWPLLLIIVFGTFLLAILLRRPISLALRAVLQRLPLIGPYLRQREALRVLSAMRMMLACGEGLLAATRAAGQTAISPLFRGLFAEAEERLVAGGTLGSVIQETPAFDGLTRMLLISGEQSNRMAELTDTACASLAARTSQGLATLVSVLTPLLTLFLGLFVGGIVLSTVSAVLQLNDIAF